MPKWLTQFVLTVAPDKTRLLRFSLFHPGWRRCVAGLGFERYWARNRRGGLRVMKRTGRKKLQPAKGRMKQWGKAKRHLPIRQFIQGQNRKQVGHSNNFGVRSHGDAVSGCYSPAIGCAHQWLNRRGAKKSSYTGSTFKAALQELGVAKPRVVQRKRQRAVFV
ncbi:MAG: hypothetical protein GKR94_27890 [Gammaproteobacteria bacterium]|nr:hypothetical protein [Gammaproteobacteria bacterium]